MNDTTLSTSAEMEERSHIMSPKCLFFINLESLFIIDEY